jgi:hypothetical protein
LLLDGRVRGGWKASQLYGDTAGGESRIGAAATRDGPLPRDLRRAAPID